MDSIFHIGISQNKAIRLVLSGLVIYHVNAINSNRSVFNAHLVTKVVAVASLRSFVTLETCI